MCILESIRSTSTETMKHLLEKVKNPAILAGLIPTLETRLGAETMVEESEELRLEQFQLLNNIVENYTENCVGYMSELAAILFKVLMDPFVPLRVLANQMLQFWSKSFHLISILTQKGSFCL